MYQQDVAVEAVRAYVGIGLETGLAMAFSLRAFAGLDCYALRKEFGNPYALDRMPWYKDFLAFVIAWDDNPSN